MPGTRSAMSFQTIESVQAELTAAREAGMDKQYIAQVLGELRTLRRRAESAARHPSQQPADPNVIDITTYRNQKGK